MSGKHVLIWNTVFSCLSKRNWRRKTRFTTQISQPHQHIHSARVPMSHSWGTPAPAPRSIQPGQLHFLHQPVGRIFLSRAPLFLTGLLLFGLRLKLPLARKHLSKLSSWGNTGSLARHLSSSPLHLNPTTCPRKAVPADSLIRTGNDSLN